MQLTIDFQAGLREQFRTLKQCVAASVYGCRIGLGGVAAHCDLSPSTLSRMLNENEDDPRHLPIDLLPKIIAATGDLRPIHWLAETFIPDERQCRAAAISTVEQLLPALTAALGELQGGRARR